MVFFVVFVIFVIFVAAAVGAFQSLSTEVAHIENDGGL
jgi:hypothetical protein